MMFPHFGLFILHNNSTALQDVGQWHNDCRICMVSSSVVIININKVYASGCIYISQVFTAYKTEVSIAIDIRD